MIEYIIISLIVSGLVALSIYSCKTVITPLLKRYETMTTITKNKKFLVYTLGFVAGLFLAPVTLVDIIIKKRNGKK